MIVGLSSSIGVAGYLFFLLGSSDGGAAYANRWSATLMVAAGVFTFWCVVCLILWVFRRWALFFHFLLLVAGIVSFLASVSS